MVVSDLKFGFLEVAHVQQQNESLCIGAGTLASLSADQQQTQASETHQQNNCQHLMTRAASSDYSANRLI